MRFHFIRLTLHHMPCRCSLQFLILCNIIELPVTADAAFEKDKSSTPAIDRTALIKPDKAARIVVRIVVKTK